MSNKDKTGPVYPHDTETGITLRQYYAGHALLPLLSKGNVLSDNEIAKAAFKIADAMIVEDSK